MHGGAGVSGDLPLTPDDVAEIVAILDGSAYERLEIRTARFRLRVARDGEGWTQQWDWSDERFGSRRRCRRARDCRGRGG